ncbi:hypothetical protein EXIGLDRAFT_828675, partial [Exidia glandulosa HHB12029]
MTTSFGLTALARALDAADQDIAQIVFSSVSLLAETAEAIRVNREAARRLSRRVNELSVTAANELQHSGVAGGSEGWEAGLADFQSSIDTAKDILVSVSQRSYLSQLLHQKRDADALDVASEHVKMAFDRLQIRNLMELYSLSTAVAAPLEHGAGLRALESQAADFDECSGPAHQTSPAPSLPPAPQLFFGRDYETETVVGSISAVAGGNVAILGGPGMGKTSIAVAAMHHPSVVARFKDRRYFVACDAVDGDSGLLTTICLSLGITCDGKAARAKLVKALEPFPSLLVLDNFETVWEAPQQRASAEDILQLLSSISGLSLILTARGAERPVGIPWTQPMLAPLGPLSIESAKQIFVAIAAIDESDQAFSKLIHELDSIPLAVTLLASQAQFEPIDSLFARWTQFRTGMLQRGDGQSRLTSLDVSIGLSLQSPRMLATPQARNVLSLLSMLPLGAASSDFAVWSSHIPSADRALAAVLQNSLAFRTPDERVRVLCPIREYMLVHHPPSYDDVHPLYAHYFGFADPDGTVDEIRPDVVTAISHEIENLDYVIRYALCAGQDVVLALQAACSMLEVFCYRGIGSYDLLPVALSVSRSSRLDDLTARLLAAAAELSIYGYLDDWPTSPLGLLQEARSLYIGVGNKRGAVEAMLGESEHLSPREAIRTCEEARDIVRQHGSQLPGSLVVQVLESLALAHRRVGEATLARLYYREGIAAARALQPPRPNVLAGIIFQSAVHSLNSDVDINAGIAALQEAIPLFKALQDVRTLAWAHYQLGIALLWQGFCTEAIDQWSATIALAKTCDDVNLEVTSWRSLVEAYLHKSNDIHASHALEMAGQCRLRRSNNWPYGDCALLRAQAALLQRQGDFSACRTTLLSALQCNEQDPGMGRRVIKLHLMCGLGEVDMEAGHSADARNWFITLLAALLYRAAQRRTDVIIVLTLLAQVVEDTTSESILEAVMLPLLHCGLPKHLALCLRLSAGIAQRRGQRELALHRARSSSRVYTVAESGKDKTPNL